MHGGEAEITTSGISAHACRPSKVQRKSTSARVTEERRGEERRGEVIVRRGCSKATRETSGEGTGDDQWIAERDGGYFLRGGVESLQ